MTSQAWEFMWFGVALVATGLVLLGTAMARWSR